MFIKHYIIDSYSEIQDDNDKSLVRIESRS